MVGGGDEGDGTDGETTDPCVTVEVALLASLVVVVGRGVAIVVVWLMLVIATPLEVGCWALSTVTNRPRTKKTV